MLLGLSYFLWRRLQAYLDEADSRPTCCEAEKKKRSRICLRHSGGRMVRRITILWTAPHGSLIDAPHCLPEQGYEGAIPSRT